MKYTLQVSVMSLTIFSSRLLKGLKELTDPAYNTHPFDYQERSSNKKTEKTWISRRRFVIR